LTKKDAPRIAEGIAARFVEARLNAAPLQDYPGAKPLSLAEAYRIQDAAIALWPGELAGWKIGLVAPDHRAAFGELRLAGPIFRENIRFVQPDETAIAPIFAGGFAAVEAEFVLRLKADAHPTRTDWNEADAAWLVESAHVGIEIASSPLAAINDLGPAVTASDFGNNAGLVVGAPIAAWGRTPSRDFTAEMFLDKRAIGKGGAESVPGGPIAALVFILNHCAARGRPLRAGDWISTGATTGVHLIEPGQTARAEFAGIGAVRCRAERALPHARDVSAVVA
jgi:2-keto-4-pentenoate hydratase